MTEGNNDMNEGLGILMKHENGKMEHGGDFTEFITPDLNTSFLTLPSFEEPMCQTLVEDSPEVKLEIVKIENVTDFSDVTDPKFAFVDPSNTDLSCMTACRSDDSLQGEVDPLSLKHEPSESLASTAATDEATSSLYSIAQKEQLESPLKFENEGCFGIKGNLPTHDILASGRVAMSTPKNEIHPSQDAGAEWQKTAACNESLVKGATWEEAAAVAGHQQRTPAPTQHKDLRQNELCELGTAAGGNGSLQSHVTSDGSGDKPFACALCSYTCKHKYSLVMHMTKHTGVMPHCCTQCNFKTAYCGVFTRHMSIHTGVKKFCCTECNYKTAHVGNLKRHMARHPGVKPSGAIAADQQLMPAPIQRKDFQQNKLCDLGMAAGGNGSLQSHVTSKGSDDKPNACALCSYRSKRKNAMVGHMSKHTGVKPFCCTDCNYKAAHLGNLKRHMARHPRVKPSEAIAADQQLMPALIQDKDLRQNKLCDLGAAADGSGCLESKVTSEGSDNKLYACALCSFFSRWKWSIVEHMEQQHAGVMPFCCNACNFKTAVVEKLQAHMSTHTGVDEFRCTECNYQCAHGGTLKRHMLIHTGVKKFCCTECNYKSSIGGDITIHMSKHTGLKMFCCSECNFKTAHSGYFKIHVKNHFGVKTFSCTECNFKTSHGRDFKRHMSTHTGAKLFCCPQCNYKTAHGGNFRKHLTIHTGVKKFCCPKCDYKTAVSGCLKTHMSKHTEVKSFCCTECNLKFTRRGHLKAHMITHTGAKIFSCTQCRFKTVYGGNLKKHSTIHTGAKKFCCTKCNFKTAVSSYFKMHLTKHTGVKNFFCTECNFKTAHGRNLENHMAQHTGHTAPATSTQIGTGRIVCTYFKKANLSRSLSLRSGFIPSG